VITSYGVSGFTEAHRAALRLYGTERVLIAYDADDAGDRGAEHVADALTRMGIECYRVHFPRGLDANAYARAETANAPPGESLGVVLRAATWLGRGAPIVAPIVAPAPAAAIASPLAAPLGSPVSRALLPASPAPMPSPVPTAREPTAALMLERHGDEVVGTIADRRYRVRGLAKTLSPDALRVNLLAQRGAAVHVDTLDLYVARARGLFIAQAATELGVPDETIKRDVGAVILALESIVADQITATLTSAAPTRAVPAMSEAERTRALARSGCARSDPRGLRARWRGRRAHEQTGGLSRSHLAQAPGAPGRDHPECERGGQDQSHGRGPRLHSAGGARAVLGDDGPGALLHGRDGSPTQSARGRRGGRRRARALCAQAFAERRRIDDREHGQRPRVGQAGDARVSRRGPSHDHAHHHGRRARRRARESRARAHRGRGPRANARDSSPATHAAHARGALGPCGAE